MPRLIVVLLLLIASRAASLAQPTVAPSGETAAPAQPVEPLRSTAAIRKLSSSELAAKPRVDFTGVILDVPGKNFPNWAQPNPQVYQDGTAIFVSVTQAKVPTAAWARMEPGDRVHIRGSAEAGNFSPVVVPETMEFLDQVPLPEATPITAADLSSGVYDGQWVSLTGVVQAIREPELQPEYWTLYHMLRIGSPHGGFRARIPVDCPASLLGSQVRVRGVCLPYLNPRGEVVGLLLHLNGLEEITVLKSGPADPFDAPQISTKAMRPFDIEQGLDSSRRRLRGVVTGVEPGSHLYLQADDRGVKVGLAEGQTAEMGDEIEASGFVSMVDGFAELSYSLVRKVGPGVLPVPVPIDSDSVLMNFQQKGPPPPDIHCKLVSLKGTFLNSSSDPTGQQTLWIRSTGTQPEPRSFPVAARPGIPLPRPGSTVEIVGVCELITPRLERLVSFARPTDLRMFLARAQDLHILHQPSWWTPARLWLLVGGIALAFAVTLFQVRSLRRRVQEGSVALAAAVVGQRAAEVRAEERERLAEEIHDIMAQSLTGVALQMSAADMAREAAPATVSHHLKLAAGLLSFARDEIRRTLLDLRSGLLDNSDLSGSLKAIVEMFGKTGACHIDWKIIGTPQHLHPLTAHSLLRVIQEAMTNSVRHGKATRIEVTLTYSDSGISLRIKDNGRGDDSSKRRGPAEGHFGLESMRGRVRRLGGDFSFTSVASEGATVEASIPLQPAPSTLATEPPPPALRPPSRRTTGFLSFTRHD